MIYYFKKKINEHISHKLIYRTIQIVHLLDEQNVLLYLYYLLFQSNQRKLKQQQYISVLLHRLKLKGVININVNHQLVGEKINGYISEIFAANCWFSGDSPEEIKNIAHSLREIIKIELE